MEFLHHENTLVAMLPPHFTVLEAKGFGQEMRARAAHSGLEIVLDATNLVYLDSFGIGSIVEVLRSVRAQGGDLRVRNLSGEPLNLFQRSGLERIIPLEEGESTQPDLSLRYGFETHGRLQVFHCAGMVTFTHDGAKFEAALQQGLASHDALLLDLSELKYMDSETIGQLARLHCEAKAQGKRFGYCNANPLVADLLKRLGVASIVPGYDSLEQAIKALS